MQICIYRWEAVRNHADTGFQRCGHLHQTRATAQKCADRLNRHVTDEAKRWRVV